MDVFKFLMNHISCLPGAFVRYLCNHFYDTFVIVIEYMLSEVFNCHIGNSQRTSMS